MSIVKRRLHDWKEMWVLNSIIGNNLLRRRLHTVPTFYGLWYGLSIFFRIQWQRLHFSWILITWWVSARAEISLRPTSWNIVAITCSISARAQNVNFQVYRSAKTQSMRMLVFLFRPGMKKMIAVTWIFQPVWSGWKSNPVWKYRARIFSPGWIPLHVIGDNLI